MKQLLVIACLFFFAGSNAQQKNEVPEDFVICAVPADAVPNYREWTDFLEKSLSDGNIISDSMPAGCYTVMLRFIVDRDGKLTDITVIKDPGYGLGEKVRKIIDGYPGRWQPAMQSGRTVKSYRKQPITFIVEEECEVQKAEETI